MANGDTRIVARDVGELAGVAGAGDDMAHAATFEAVEQIFAGQHCRRRNDDGAELDRRQHHFPEGNDVADHQQDRIATADTMAAQEIRHTVGTFGQIAKAELGLSRIATRHPQCRPVVVSGVGVEPVERPVEGFQLRPPELRARPLMVVALRHQDVSCFDECFCRSHGCLPIAPSAN